MAIFAVLGLRVKTLDHPGLDIGDVIRRYPLGGVVVEPRRAHLSVFGGKCGAPCFSFSIYVICFLRGSTRHFVSVRPLGFIYKTGRKPISMYKVRWRL